MSPPPRALTASQSPFHLRRPRATRLFVQNFRFGILWAYPGPIRSVEPVAPLSLGRFPRGTGERPTDKAGRGGGVLIPTRQQHAELPNMTSLQRNLGLTKAPRSEEIFRGIIRQITNQKESGYWEQRVSGRYFSPGFVLFFLIFL